MRSSLNQLSTLLLIQSKLSSCKMDGRTKKERTGWHSLYAYRAIWACARLYPWASMSYYSLSFLLFQPLFYSPETYINIILYIYILFFLSFFSWVIMILVFFVLSPCWCLFGSAYMITSSVLPVFFAPGSSHRVLYLITFQKDMQ